MTDWPDEFGVVEIGDNSWIVSTETLRMLNETVDELPDTRVGWAGFTTLHGDQFSVRVERIDALRTCTRESRLADAAHARHLRREKKAAVPGSEWEDADDA